MQNINTGITDIGKYTKVGGTINPVITTGTIKPEDKTTNDTDIINNTTGEPVETTISIDQATINNIDTVNEYSYTVDISDTGDGSNMVTISSENDEMPNIYKNMATTNDNLSDYQALIKKMDNTGITQFQGQTKIWGAPFKWLPTTDPIREIYSTTSNKYKNKYSYGYVYGKNFINDADLVYLRIGLPIFLPGARKKDKEQLLRQLASEDKDLGEENTNMELDMPTTLRYYGFRNAFNQFEKIYLKLVASLARKMGIHDINFYKNFNNIRLADEFIKPAYIKGKYVSSYVFNKLGDSNRTKNEDTNAASLFNQALCFYGQDISVSESFSNDTGDSKLAANAKTSGAFMREAQFLFGIGGANKLKQTAAESYTESLLGDFNFGWGVLDRLKSGISVAVQGGNILFPEIWQDSRFTRNYNIKFIFSTPYGDPKSILEHVYMPALMWICAAMPRQLGAMGYAAPYLVKCSSKGNFNCDLGIVGSVNINRCPPDEFTIDGLPTKLEVDVTIKDLYSALILTSPYITNFWTANTALKEYLNTLAGITFTQVDISEEVLYQLDSVMDAINIPQKVINTASSAIDNIQSSILNVFKNNV